MLDFFLKMNGYIKPSSYLCFCIELSIFYFHVSVLIYFLKVLHTLYVYLHCLRPLDNVTEEIVDKL